MGYVGKEMGRNREGERMRPPYDRDEIDPQNAMRLPDENNCPHKYRVWKTENAHDFSPFLRQSHSAQCSHLPRPVICRIYEFVSVGGLFCAMLFLSNCSPLFFWAFY